MKQLFQLFFVLNFSVSSIGQQVTASINCPTGDDDPRRCPWYRFFRTR